MYTPDDLAHIDLIEKKVYEQFPADCYKKYPSGAALQDEMQQFGSAFGVALARLGHRIECTRAPRERRKRKAVEPAPKPKASRNRVTQRCGCMFFCNEHDEDKNESVPE
jgi:hypothetical protein